MDSMVHARQLPVVIAFTLACASALAKPPAKSPSKPLPVLGSVEVHAEVSLSNDGIFTYTYSLTNPAASQGPISIFNIDISTPPGSAKVERQGLVNGPRFQKRNSKWAMEKTGTAVVIPVGLDSPNGWITGLTKGKLAGWGAQNPSQMVGPGQTVGGLIMTSRGLPGLRAYVVKPHLNAGELPIRPPQSPADLPRYRHEWKTIEDSVTARGMTIGPGAPPAVFRASEFIRTIDLYREAAVQRGWIPSAPLAADIAAKLAAAGAALNTNDTALKTALDGIISDIEGDHTGGIRPEGAALLKYNIQYLLTNIQGGKT